MNVFGSPYLRELCRTNFVGHTQHSVWEYMFSTDVLFVTPTETMFSKIQFANFARKKFHCILRQRLWSLEVRLAQSQWSSMFDEFDDLPELSLVCHLLLSSKIRPTQNRSWTHCKWVTHSLENCPTCQYLSQMLSTRSKCCGPSNYLLRYSVVESSWWISSMFLALVSVLLQVSPCCQRWFQRLHACGLPKRRTLVWTSNSPWQSNKTSQRLQFAWWMQFRNFFLFIRFSMFFALKLIALGFLPAVSPELPPLRSSICSPFLVHQFFLNIDHVSVVILPIRCSEEISPGRLGKLSRQDEKTIKWLQEWVWCNKKPKRCNNCDQRSHVNEPLVNTSAICCAVFTYFCLNCFQKVDAIKLPIKTNSVGSGNVSHVGALAFEAHFHHSSVVFTNMNRRSHAGNACARCHNIATWTVVSDLFLGSCFVWDVAAGLLQLMVPTRPWLVPQTQCGDLVHSQTGISWDNFGLGAAVRNTCLFLAWPCDRHKMFACRICTTLLLM